MFEMMICELRQLPMKRISDVKLPGLHNTRNRYFLKGQKPFGGGVYLEEDGMGRREGRKEGRGEIERE